MIRIQQVTWLLAFVCLRTPGFGQVDADLLTVAERTGFKATARHEDVEELCRALAARSDAVLYVELGKSVEGRSIPMLVVANPPVQSAGQARQSGKLVVLALGNIHAGEVDGKEALPMLVRELTDAPNHPLLENVILAVVPNYNPDGNERVDLNNRPGQVGPEAGMGRRENAQGLDLNRDFVKLEAPETRALVSWMNEWNPHMFIDTHTTNGSRHRYTITHAGPKHPAGDAGIIQYTHHVLLPAVSDALEQKHGWRSFVYGNFNRDRTRWTTYGAEPRYSTSYVGLRGRIGILSEAYAYASYEDRVKATRDFVREILAFAADRKAEIKEQLERAATGSEPGSPVAIRSRMRPREHPALVLGYVEGKRDAETNTATDEHKEYMLELWDVFEPLETATRPAAYLLPASFSAVAETLQQHGLEVDTLREDVVLGIEAYKVIQVKRSERVFQGHRLVTEIEVELHARKGTIQAGSYLIKATGALGSLAVMLLEPRSEDGLTTWGAFDEALVPGQEFPVVRLPTLPPYPILTAARASGSRNQPAASSPPQAQRGRSAVNSFGFERWLDADHFAQRKQGKRWKVHAVIGEAEPLADEPAENRSALVTGLSEIPTIGKAAASSLAQRLRFDPSRTGGYAAHQGDLYYIRSDGSGARRLTNQPGEEELAEFSPDGRFIAFVRDNDLFVVDVSTGTEHALTAGGNDRLRHGKADWVYFEELFNRSWKAFWWSPDSAHIAFLRLDDAMVPTHHVLVDTGPKRTVEETAYPRAGEPNPWVSLGIVAVGGGDPIYANLNDYSSDSFLISDVGWWPDGSTVYFYGQDRAQTWLDVLTMRPQSDQVTRLFRETTKAWVESLGPIYVLKDGTFLVASERDGWKHLYRYNSDGSLRNQVTSGEWELQATPPRIDEENGWVYVSGTQLDALGLALYRARLDGSSVEMLSAPGGTHTASPNPDGSLFIDQSSSRLDPPSAVLRKADGTIVRVLDNGAGEQDESPNRARRELARIPARDGVLLEAEVFLPANLDTSGATLYPVWLTTYGGPHAPTIREVWSGSGGASSPLLTEGIIVFRVDPRSASGKGARSAWTAYRQLGVQEMKDIEDAVTWLKQRPYVDPDRIGMEGHSYGGYLTAYCMTHSNLFAAGIAGAPVTDWHDYDSIYTERYMDTPQNNPEGYKASSVVEAAGQLHGKLLILHGGIDDNVSVRNTMRLIHALQQANKDFELMIYPGSRHGIFNPHYARLKSDFIRRTIGGPRPRPSASAEATEPSP